MNGSGEALISTRALGLVEMAAGGDDTANENPAARASPGLSAATAKAASSAPAGMRTNVCNASHRVSNPGTLSAKNSVTNSVPEAAITAGWKSICRLVGQRRRAGMVKDAEKEQHGVEPHAVFRPAQSGDQRGC